MEPLRGNSISRINFKYHLMPEELNKELEEYREVFGKNFSLFDLIEIYKVKAIAELAADVADLPELLTHELKNIEKIKFVTNHKVITGE